jgi:hypothetical protein
MLSEVTGCWYRETEWSKSWYAVSNWQRTWSRLASGSLWMTPNHGSNLKWHTNFYFNPDTLPVSTSSNFPQHLPLSLPFSPLEAPANTLADKSHSVGWKLIFLFALIYKLCRCLQMWVWSELHSSLLLLNISFIISPFYIFLLYW